MLNLMAVVNATNTSANVSCTCNCKRYTSLQSMEITQLEFVQILVIVVVLMVMVVVITCLLNHYRHSARRQHRHNMAAAARHRPLANEAGLWSSDGTATHSSMNEHQVYNPRPPDRPMAPPPSSSSSSSSSSHLHLSHNAPLLHSHHTHHPHSSSHHPHPSFYAPPTRFQPVYPYLPQSLVGLPPNIGLSDGETPPPYTGPCQLQLRDPEQQLELNRESVRAPPNRTVFDSHRPRSSDHGPCLHASLEAPPPSVHSGVSVMEAQEALSRQHKQQQQQQQQQQNSPGVGGAPPAYSEVIIGHYYQPPAHTHRTVAPPQGPTSFIQGLIRPPPPPRQGSSLDSRNARNSKEKSHKPQQV